MIRNREAMILGLWAATLLGAPSALAAPGPASRPVPRASRPAPKSKPPDVRRGEPYDGRAPAVDPGHGLRLVPRTLLFLPRVAVTLVSRTTVATLDWLQRSGIGPLLHRICFAVNGRLVTLPTISWERGLTPKAGVSMTTNLLFGRSRRAGLHAEAAAGHRDTWHAALKLFPLGLPAATRNKRLGLVFRTRYDRRHDRPFFGRGYARAPVGLDSDDFEARLDAEIFTADAMLAIGLWRSVALELAVGTDWRRLNDADLPPPTAATLAIVDALGDELVARQDVAFTAGMALTVGGPVERLIPAVGFRARLSALARVGVHRLGTHLDLAGSLEGFTGLWGTHRRLGLRARIRAVVRADDHTVPALHLPCQGGADSMRGFVTGRFCGESLASLTASYHHRLHPRLWLSLFIDWGGAFREGFADSSLSAVDVAGGAALALRITRLNWMRLQVAGSRDGAAVFIGWGGAP